ncbi:hypothetical protein AVEN_251411-1 [Araneus ventricosus]|uniref:Uncharacterized protein n=1 Tax=Araneus ventricosus TaxID=182803 RepID=A0A4Y2L1S9_ARAVE|nr:hypothetical protein AVEN_251411-1 [Araneus ventricosus]
MSKCGFELREWEHTGECKETNNKNETQVLGLLWNKELDTLNINMYWLDDLNMEKISKRSILSIVQKVFDPFGFVSPVMLCPKIMLQKAWRMGISWDQEITDELRKEFLQWFQELRILKDIQIPRCIQTSSKDLSSCTIHTFVDGRKDDYAAVTFSIFEKGDRIELFLLAAKSRVAPLRGVTISADLPSRGCKAKQLITLRWWERPHWLKDSSQFKIIMDSSNQIWNEGEIGKEKSKTTYTLTSNEGITCYYRYFSNYVRIIRLVAWILCFKHNCQTLMARKQRERHIHNFIKQK